MNFKEYGDISKKNIMLLHGGGLSWWNYKEEAERKAREQKQREEEHKRAIEQI